MIAHLLYGWRLGWKLWKVALIVYFVLLFLAMTVGMQVYQVMEASIGRSLSLNSLLSGYDNTVISDFLNVHGASISPLIGQLRWLILAYIIFSIFFNAGLVFVVIKRQNSWRAFWGGAARYFFPFLKLALVFGGLTIIWTLLTVVQWAGNFTPLIETTFSDKSFLMLSIVVAVIYLFGLTFLFAWSVNARIGIVRLEYGFLTSLKKGCIIALRKYGRILILSILLAFILLILISLYLLIGETSGMISMLSVLVFFVIQQLIVYFRIIWRMMLYASIDSVCWEGEA